MCSKHTQNVRMGDFRLFSSEKLTLLVFFMSAREAALELLLENSKGFFCSALSLTRSNVSMLTNLEYAWSANDFAVPFDCGSEDKRFGACPLSIPIDMRAGSAEG